MQALNKTNYDELRSFHALISTDSKPIAGTVVVATKNESRETIRVRISTSSGK